MLNFVDAARFISIRPRVGKNVESEGWMNWCFGMFAYPSNKNHVVQLIEFCGTRLKKFIWQLTCGKH